MVSPREAQAPVCNPARQQGGGAVATPGACHRILTGKRLDQLEGLWELLAQEEGALGGVDSLVFFPESGVDGCAGVGNRGVRGIGGFRFAQGGDGLLGLVGGAAGEAQIVPGTRESRFEVDGGFERFDGAGEIAGLTECQG